MQTILASLGIFLRSYLPHLLLVAALMRACVFGAEIGDAIVVVGLVTLCGYYKYTEAETVKWRDIVNKEIQDVKTFINTFKVSMTMGDGKINEPKSKSGQPRRYF